MATRNTLLAVLCALAGGLLGVLGAIFEEVAGAHALLWIIAVPAIEEIMKPIGIVFLLDKRPHWMSSAGQVVVLSLLGALVFASIENALYFWVYQPQQGADYRLYRLTVCTGLHLVATGVFGVGLAKMWRHIRDKGGRFDIDVCFKYYVAAAVIHGLYNFTVTILSATGVLDFDGPK